MTPAVTVANGKGGVGKTTTAVNLADRLSARGESVALVDVDQQGNATESVGLADAYEEEPHLGHVFEGTAELGDIVRAAAGENWIDVVPAHRDLDEVASNIKDSALGELKLRNEVVGALEESHDWVVIDAPPTIGPMSDSALIAAQNVVVPLLMSEGSVSGLERLVEQQLAPIRKEIDVEIVAIVPNRLSGDNEEKRIIDALESAPQFEPRLPAFARSDHFEDHKSPGPGIRKRAEIKRSQREGVPLSSYDPQNDMIERYDQLAEFVVEEVAAHA